MTKTRGWKTYLAATGMFIVGSVEVYQGLTEGSDPTPGFWKILEAIGIGGLRHAVT